MRLRLFQPNGAEAGIVPWHQVSAENPSQIPSTTTNPLYPVHSFYIIIKHCKASAGANAPKDIALLWGAWIGFRTPGIGTTPEGFLPSGVAYPNDRVVLLYPFFFLASTPRGTHPPLGVFFLQAVGEAWVK